MRGPLRIQKNSTRTDICFGFGRRPCPGHHIARANIFIVISCLLWGYDIKYERADTDYKGDAFAGKTIFVVEK